MRFTHRILCLTILFSDVFRVAQNQILSPNRQANMLKFETQRHNGIVKYFYQLREDWKTSKVGDLLYKNKDINEYAHLKKPFNFVIYLYNDWSVLYTDADLGISVTNSSFLESCSVKNCIFTRDKKARYSSHALLVSLYKAQLPDFQKRRQSQKWVLMSLESPINIFRGAAFPEKAKLENFADKFNWVMSYRVDADVPIPYGRTIPRQAPIIVDMNSPEDALAQLVPYWKLKQIKYPLATLVSNCIFKERIKFVRRLMKVLPVDVYGDCAIDRSLKKSCPGGLTDDCHTIPHYLFYLSMENSNCRQYLTEKIFFRAFAKGAVPIIWGALYEDCLRLLPPHSFIHVDDFETYDHLARYLAYLIENKADLLKYHLWRKHFIVSQEHGFSGTTGMQFCRLCEALNYNDDALRVYTYKDLLNFFDVNSTCLVTTSAGLFKNI